MELEFRCGRLREGSYAANLRAHLLGSEPRYAPDQDWDSLHIRLELQIHPQHRTVQGICTTALKALAEKTNRILFDAVAMRIQGVSLDSGKKCAYRYDGKKLSVRLPRSWKRFEILTLSIRYSLKNPPAGLHFIRRPLQVWSQGQPEESRFWFPCHDAPHEKATSEVVATVPSGFVAVSNGILAEDSRNPKTKKATFHWQMNSPHSVYLIALAIGRFGTVEEKWENIPVLYFCEKGREEEARRGFGKTPKAMEFFSRKIGLRYPYEKYAQVAAAQFPGGMENTTCTLQTDAALLDARAALDVDFDRLVAHELAHQWFGDLLTCRDWSHAWLNEGFATYFEALFTEHDKGKEEFQYELHENAQAYFHETEKRYHRPVVSSLYKHPHTLFDRHLYEKGAAVLHMLRHLLGEESWWEVIRHYVKRCRNQSVETKDFLEAIRAVTGKNAEPFFDQWVFAAGYPSLTAYYHWEKSKKTVSLWITQKQSGPGFPNCFKFPITFEFYVQGRRKRFQEQIEKKEHTFSYRLAAEPRMAFLDPENVILKKLRFIKPLALFQEELLHAPHAICRLQAAQALASYPSAEILELFGRAFRREKFWGVQAEIARSAGAMRLPQALELLTLWARTPHPKARRAVLRALGNFSVPKAHRLLEQVCRRDPSYLVAAQALRSLAQAGGPRTAKMISENLQKKSWWEVLRAAAVSALADQKKLREIPRLIRFTQARHPYPLRSAAIRGLLEAGGPRANTFQILLGLLCDPDERIQILALRSIGEWGNNEATDAIQKLQKKTANQRIQSACQEAIAQIRGHVDSPT